LKQVDGVQQLQRGITMADEDLIDEHLPFDSRVFSVMV
jgi:hypothetical protein